MKKLFFLLLIVFSYVQAAYCQSLHIDSTRFITGNKPGTEIFYAIPTADKGILFLGYDGGNPGGIIPKFPLDTTLDNVLIGKIDSNQQISWIKVYGGSKDDDAISACQTPDGGYAVLATTESKDGDVTGFKGGNDLWLLRIDGSGNLLWGKTYGSSAGDVAISVANTPDGGFILLGATNGSDGDVQFHYGGEFSLDWLVIRTDSAGNKEWSKDIGGTGDEDERGSILSIDSSYYLISGSNSTDHDCTDLAWHTGVNTSDDYYILKLDDTGRVVWNSSYGGSSDDGAYQAIYDTRDSTIVINGYTASGDYMVTGSPGGGDMWVIKVNKNGALIWQKTLGSPQVEVGTGICIGPGGGYIAYGSTYIGPIGDEDAWLFLVDSAGNEIGNKVLGGTANELPYSVVPYLSGYVATGNSISSVYTEGTTNGRNCIGEEAFISYTGYWPLSINNISSPTAPTMTVFPNPSQNTARILFSDHETGTIKVINCTGQVVYTETVKTQYTDISIEEWSAGVYCIVWQGENGSVLTTKFVKA